MLMGLWRLWSAVVLIVHLDVRDIFKEMLLLAVLWREQLRLTFLSFLEQAGHSARPVFFVLRYRVRNFVKSLY